jgi:hypothetical protein
MAGARRQFLEEGSTKPRRRVNRSYESMRGVNLNATQVWALDAVVMVVLLYFA